MIKFRTFLINPEFIKYVTVEQLDNQRGKYAVCAYVSPFNRIELVLAEDLDLIRSEFDALAELIEKYKQQRQSGNPAWRWN